MVTVKVFNDITLCLGCTRKLQSNLVGVSNYCCQKCTLDNPCKKPECAAAICIKHGTQLSYNPSEGYMCSQCQREIWDKEAEAKIKGFKCPVCSAETEVKYYDENFVEFGCKPVLDDKPPCPSFRIILCDDCYRNPCHCQEPPQQEGRKLP